MSRLQDESAIRALQARYADICSRRDFSELPEVISADARIQLDLRGKSMAFDGPTELGEFIEASISVFDFFQFVIRNIVFHMSDAPHPTHASTRTWMSELRHHRESGQWSTIFGVYHDRYQRSSHGWRISFRQYHSLARIAHTLDDCTAFDFPAAFGDLAAFDAGPKSV